MERNKTSHRMILLTIMLAIFSVTAFMNWLDAGSHYWYIILHEAGFYMTEIVFIILYKGTLIRLLGLGTSLLLLLLNYYSGRKYRVTRSSTIIFVLSLMISTLLGLAFGYGMKQLELPHYSILNIYVLYRIPSELGSKTVWCMLGMLAGNYKREIEKKVAE